MIRKGLVTVIITVWKREYLEQQLDSLVGQSAPPGEIWVLQNEDHIDIHAVIARIRSIFPAVYLIHSAINLKYFGRFSLCWNVNTEYILIIDDDVIPGARWLEICMQKCDAFDAIISCSGRIIPSGRFRPEEWHNDERKEYFIGDNYNDEESNQCPEDTWVDYGCNSYFFKTAWIRHFWQIWPCTFLSGEDIHLSASLMIAARIRTLIPRQICSDTSGNMKKYYSQDHFSSWKDPSFIDLREPVFKYFILEQKWRPLLWKQ